MFRFLRIIHTVLNLKIIFLIVFELLLWINNYYVTNIVAQNYIEKHAWL